MIAAVIAGASSGCGKTSVSLGLMTALRRRGLKVQAFKCGPDFIDPSLHAYATGRPSHNLDSWMLAPHALRDIFYHACQGADVAIVEGAMGLFDGHSTQEAGSTAHVAKILNLPVILVMDAQATGRSLAAAAHGFATFDPELQLAAVVANRVGSPRHQQIVASGLQGAGIPLGAAVPKVAATLPHRHLGLVTPDELPHLQAHLDILAEALEDCGAVDRLLPFFAAVALPHLPPQAEPQGKVRLAVARDPAFCFYYEDNLRRLRQAGAEIVPFSPLTDPALPSPIHGIYLGGGYPEVHAAALAANVSMRQHMAQAWAAGLPVLAECGGWMYLMEAIVDAQGRRYPMVGIFGLQAVMESRRQALGYRKVCLAADCSLGMRGTHLRGHEFHYSRIHGHDPQVQPLFCPPYGVEIGARKGSCLATYVHLHLGSCPSAAAAWVQACLA